MGKEVQLFLFLLSNLYVKVGKNSDKLFFNNLVKEIRLYESNQDNKIMPRLIDSFVSDKYCLIVLEKLNLLFLDC